MIRNPRTLLAVGAAALVAACGSNPTDIGVETPPLSVRQEGTVPRDSTEHLFEADGISLVVNFNREFSADEVTLVEFIPRPAEWGAVQRPASNRHQIVIHDVVFDSFHAAYRLVIDGPAMPEPRVLTYCGGVFPNSGGATEGRITFAGFDRDPVGALVYALPSRPLLDEFQVRAGEFTLFDHPVLGVSQSSVQDSGAQYRLTGLVVGVRYIIVAIIDLDRDGIYDLTADWWGYHRDFEHRPIEVVAGLQVVDSRDPAGPEMPVGVDVSVLPPGSLENPYKRLPDVLE